jgi:hypothetical protein
LGQPFPEPQPLAGAEVRRRLAVPAGMLRRGYAELARCRVLAVLAARLMLVHNDADQACYAIKVCPHTITFLKLANEFFAERRRGARGEAGGVGPECSCSECQVRVRIE